MKNLKKVLALVLAFACAFTMFAGAAFTDQADISQTEAVDMLSALGVINGYTDGSFKPDATITRAEAAKMIYTIWNGGNDDASAFEWKSVFNDVYSGHWAEGYINFCYTNGIINGTSATTFSPEEAVTGTQLAKMLLICMGYQADKSGLEGTGYSQRTNALATQNGLYNDVAASVSTAMPRQYAAQIMYNALKADTVLWSTDNNAYSKVSTTSYKMVQNANGTFSLEETVTYETMGKKCMGLETIEDVQVRKVETENGRDTFKVTTNLSTDFTRVATDYSDLVGMTVNVMVKDDDFSKVYGMYVDEDCSVVATGVVGQLEKDDNDTFKLAGTSYDVDSRVNNTFVYTMNDDTSYSDAIMLDTIIEDSASAKNDAYSIKLIDTDNDGDVNHAVITPVYVAKVTYVNNNSIRIDSKTVQTGDKDFAPIDTSYDFDDHNIADGIERDDWVVITAKDYTVDGEAVITKADVVSGTVGAVHGDTNDRTEVRVDGTWYKTADVVEDRDTNVSNNVELVVYGGMYFSVDGSAASLDVAAVTGVGNWNNMDDIREVRLMFQDGSEEVVNVEAWDKYNLENVAPNKDVLVTYEIDDDKYTLTTIDGSKDIADTKYDSAVITRAWEYDESRATIEAGSTYDIDDGAMIVIKNRDGDYIYMTGADLKNRNDIKFNANGYLVFNDDMEVVAMFGSTSSSISSGTKQYGYIVDLGREYIDGKYVLVIDVITADGLQEGVLTDQDNVGNFNQYDIISYTMNGDEMVITEETGDFYYGSIADYTSSRVRFANGDRYTLTSDTSIIAIENSGSDDADFAGTSLSEAENANHINAIFVMDDDTDVAAIFVEVEADQDFGNKTLDHNASGTKYQP